LKINEVELGTLKFNGMNLERRATLPDLKTGLVDLVVPEFGVMIL
jgi:hypothetical protein